MAGLYTRFWSKIVSLTYFRLFVKIAYLVSLFGKTTYPDYMVYKVDNFYSSGTTIDEIKKNEIHGLKEKRRGKNFKGPIAKLILF